MDALVVGFAVLCYFLIGFMTTGMLISECQREGKTVGGEDAVYCIFGWPFVWTMRFGTWIANKRSK